MPALFAPGRLQEDSFMDAKRTSGGPPHLRTSRIPVGREKTTSQLGTRQSGVRDLGTETMNRQPNLEPRAASKEDSYVSDHHWLQAPVQRLARISDGAVCPGMGCEPVNEHLCP